MTDREDIIINLDEAEEHEHLDGQYFGGYYKVLTTMEQMGHLGVNLSRVPPGRTACPFHSHQLEDEVFIVLEGRGTLRYGEDRFEIGPGDCISCEAGSGLSHQIGNTGDVDLLYLSIGYNDPNEVCTYPDSDTVMVRSLGKVGRFESTKYGDGEPVPPKILDSSS